MKDFKRILIVRTDRIGDVVLTTPAVKALRLFYPKAFLAMLVSSQTKDLVQGIPFIDEVIVDDRNEKYQRWRFFNLVNLIRRERFDLAVIFHTKKRTNSLCFFAGIPMRLGYRNNKFGFLLTHKINDLRPEGKKHEAQYCLDVLKGLGIESEDLQTTVPLRNECEQWADDFINTHNLAGEKLFAIHSGSSCPTKKWPAHKFVALIAALQEKYPGKVVLVGGVDNVETASIIKEGGQGNVLDLTGQTSVGQLASLLKRCYMLISNDSGPVHVGDAVGTPVVSIFTRNQPGINPERWRPLSPRSRAVVTSFVEDVSFAKGEVLDPEFLKIITVEEVLEAVDDVFKLC